MCFYRARGARSNLRLSVIFKHKRTTNCTAAGSTKYNQCSVGGWTVAQWTISSDILSTY